VGSEYAVYGVSLYAFGRTGPAFVKSRSEKFGRCLTLSLNTVPVWDTTPALSGPADDKSREAGSGTCSGVDGYTSVYDYVSAPSTARSDI
jgi:hypothetical protein